MFIHLKLLYFLVSYTLIRVIAGSECICWSEMNMQAIQTQNIEWSKHCSGWSPTQNFLSSKRGLYELKKTIVWLIYMLI